MIWGDVVDDGHDFWSDKQKEGSSFSCILAKSTKYNLRALLTCLRSIHVRCIHGDMTTPSQNRI